MDNPFHLASWKSGRNLKCIESESDRFIVGREYYIMDGWLGVKHIWWVAGRNHSLVAMAEKFGCYICVTDHRAIFKLEE